MDIVLLVAFEDLGGRHNRPGDIMFVDSWHDGVCGNERNVLIGVRNIPDNAPEEVLLRRIRTMLQEPIRLHLDGGRVLRKRAFRIRLQDAPLAIRQQLQTTRRVDVEWSQIRPHIYKRVLVDINDRDLDTNTPITDEDL